MKKLLPILLVACGSTPPPTPPPVAPPAPPPPAPKHVPLAAHMEVPAATVAKPPGADETFLTDCRATIAKATAEIDALVAVSEKRTVANTLEPFNDIGRLLDNADEWASLLAEVHPDPKLRDAARTCAQEAEKVGSALKLDRRVFDALHALDVSGTDADTKRFYAMTIRDFRRAGVDTDDKTRARLEDLDEQITALGQTFSKNIAEDTRHITVSKDRLGGLPADWIAAHPADASGNVTITTDYPDYYPVMTYADDDALRKELYVAFLARADAHNPEILQKVLALRAEKAHLLGFSTWADYESDDKMLRTGKAAAQFIEQIYKLAAPRAKQEYAELLAQAKKKDPKATGVSVWQTAYLENQVKRDKYAVDANQVRSYFAFDKVLAGLLQITSRIYDIAYVPVTDPRTWHPDVQVYDVVRKGEKLGRIFLDMHPRDGKYKHAAQFTITTGIDGVQLPEGALVCNLPAGSAQMDHGDVVVMFHEFGHLMHHVLGGRHHWLRQSGVATERDFVEAPSQMFEEWAWSYETLSTFSTIPKELVEKMRRAERFGKGQWVTRQLFLSALSLRLHQDDPAKLDQNALVKTLQNRYMLFPYVDGTTLQASFGHLIGYSSMYYTYMWSLVIARDLLTAFDKQGLLATEVTHAYRDKILVPGGTKDAAELVKNFLGRPYSVRAFESYLRGQ